MDSSNHWYGHAHILARYCGLDEANPPVIWGVLQHGWNILHGFGPGHEPPPGFTRFVWSDRPVRRGQAIGWRDYYVIGAPWNYLAAMEPSPPDDAREGTIFYPFHTWDHGEIEGDHDRLIREVLDTETGPLTACLYWIEYEQEHIRRAYAEAGFRVICHGKRGTFRKDTDPRFLYRQHEEISRHRRVISNRLTTAVFYGASLGCDVAVYGDPMRYFEVRDHLAHVVDGNERARRLFPELHGHEVDRATAAAVAAAELGTDRMATPEELKEMFGWRTA